MPDILIRGMEMPRVGCVIAICANGDVIDTQDNVLGHAVELPPHGELHIKDGEIVEQQSC